MKGFKVKGYRHGGKNKKMQVGKGLEKVQPFHDPMLMGIHARTMKHKRPMDVDMD